MSSNDTGSDRIQRNDQAESRSSRSPVDMRDRNETQALTRNNGSHQGERDQDEVTVTNAYRQNSDQRHNGEGSRNQQSGGGWNNQQRGDGSGNQQSGDNSNTSQLIQALQNSLTDIDNNTQQISSELSEILGYLQGNGSLSGGGGSSETSGGGSSESTGSGSTETSGGGSTETSGSGSSESTGSSGVTATNAPGPAEISTPSGTETVGSTATAFGPQAMPASDQTSQNAYYVSADATGDGTGTLGSANNPFSTLQQAQQAMENGDTKTTYVEGGTYNLSSTLNLTSADSGESFIAASGSSPAVVDGGGSVSNLIDVNGANNVSIEGLTLQNTGGGSIFDSGDWTQSATAGDAIVAQNSTGDNFSYNAVSNVGMGLDMRGVTNSQFNGNSISDVQEAISLSSASGNSDNDTISGNSISNVSDVSSSPYGAISLMQASNDTISNNVINNITGAGIRVGGNIGQDSNNDEVVQNTVTNTNTASYATSSYSGQGDNGAIYAWQGPGNTNNMNLTIANNYIANAGAGFENIGVYLDDGVDGANVTNNVINPNGMGWATDIHGGSNNTIANNVIDLSSSTGQEKALLYQNDGPQMTGNTFSENIVYSSTDNGGAITEYDNANDTPDVTNNEYSGVSAASGDSNPVNADPQFVDPSSGNYEVASGSPATSIGF
ncbi:MAG TPA: right-handed parallel beta-helix repeat-containing protein [Planktothrix sp.]|jgi:hypothetical protein